MTLRHSIQNRRAAQILSRSIRFEHLEHRRLLASLELSSLLTENGGDGTAGFVATLDNHIGANASISASGDINGDGYTDFLINHPGFNTVDQKGGKPQEKIEGAVFVVYGDSYGIPPTVDLGSLNGTNGFVIRGNPDDVNAGENPLSKVTSGQDMNGDNIDDIVVMVRQADPGGRQNAGRVYVLFGDTSWGNTSFPSVLELKDLVPSNGADGHRGFVINGVDNTTYFSSIALDGDINGDAVADLVLGTPGTGSGDFGRSHVVFGRVVDSNGDGLADHPFPAELELSTIDGTNGVTFTGAAAGDWSGFSVSNGGDLNGDGFDEVVIGAPEASPDGRVGAGKVFVVYGTPSLPAAIDLSTLNGSSGFVVNGIGGDLGSVSGDVAGASVFSGGDFNGDGISDLAIGAPRAARDATDTEVGAGYVVFGRGPGETPISAGLELSSLDGSNGFAISGLDADDSFARHVELTDLNADGFADFVLSAPGGDPDGRIDAGEVYVVFGTSDSMQDAELNGLLARGNAGALVVNGIAAGDMLGGGHAANSTLGETLSLGDVNGDGITDLAFANYHGRGEGFVLFGNTDFGRPIPAVLVSKQAIETTEAGGTASFEVLLATQPTADVVITITSSDPSEGTVAPSTLVFTSAIWDQPQSVTVTGVDDLNQDGDVAYTIVISPAVSNDPRYDGFDPPDLAGVNLDDEVPSLVDMYVASIDFDSKRGGKDYRAVIVVHAATDADGDGLDDVLAGATIQVTFGGQSFIGLTDEYGVFQTDWVRDLNGDRTANVVDLALEGFVWNPLDLDKEGDSDQDGFPDDVAPA